jgi:triosephosphate isomerase (TIM)
MPKEGRYFCEDDHMINKKVLAALRNGLKPILCIGEQKKNLKTYNIAFAFLKKQLKEALKNVQIPRP